MRGREVFAKIVVVVVVVAAAAAVAVVAVAVVVVVASVVAPGFEPRTLAIQAFWSSGGLLVDEAGRGSENQCGWTLGGVHGPRCMLAPRFEPRTSRFELRTSSIEASWPSGALLVRR